METAGGAGADTQRSEMTDRAIVALGDAPKGDYVLRPEFLAAILPEDAGPLKRILLRPELKATLDTFKKADSKAVSAQTLYKSLANIATISGLGSVVVAFPLLLDRPDSWLRLFEVGDVLVFVLLAISYGASLWIAWRRPYDAWMTARALAESQRAKLFNNVVSATEPSRTGEIDPLPLQLEYVRRYLLDDQITYYNVKGDYHKLVAQKLSRIKTGFESSAFLAIVPALIICKNAVVLPQLASDALNFVAKPFVMFGGEKSFHLLALLGSSFQTTLAALEEQSHHSRNAKRYPATAASLDRIRTTDLGKARQAASSNDRATVLAFVRSIQDEIGKEHSEWLVAHQVDQVEPINQPDLTITSP